MNYPQPPEALNENGQVFDPFFAQAEAALMEYDAEARGAIEPTAIFPGSPGARVENAGRSIIVAAWTPEIVDDSSAAPI